MSGLAPKDRHSVLVHRVPMCDSGDLGVMRLQLAIRDWQQ